MRLRNLVRSGRYLRSLAVSSALMLALAGAAAGEPVTIAIYGDSLGRGDGAQTRWHDRLAALLEGPVELIRGAVSRQDMRRLVRNLESEPPPEGSVVIIYDRRNAGETADDWMNRLEQALALLPTEHVLVMPQVPVSGGREDRNFSAVLNEINKRLRSTYPELSLNQAEETALLAALAGDETRSDRIHRNDVGQQIEATFMARWLVERGWVVAASDADL